jgi:DNA modification methylase
LLLKQHLLAHGEPKGLFDLFLKLSEKSYTSFVKKNNSNKSRLTKSWFVMPYQLKDIPIKGDTDARYPESFVKIFLEEFTDEGDIILDPFAGYGTTLIVAQRMKRVGIGIEYEKKKCAYIQKNLKEPSIVIHGDSRKLSTYEIPKCDFSITSPPYMRSHDKENPLTSNTKSGEYKEYLQQMKNVYMQVKQIMKRNALIVLEVSNTYDNKHQMTPLAWDMAKILSEVLYFENEIIFCHKNGESFSSKVNHSYCLLFRNK